MKSLINKITPVGLDLQGHRGCRGLFPENTIPAFNHALHLGITTLEMDVVITKDLQVIVSHEPFMNHEICLKPDGSEILESEELNHNIYRMTYKDVAQWDCGLKQHPRFPIQKKLKCIKPLLNDVLKTALHYSGNFHRHSFFNIEIKSTPAYDQLFHPPIDQYSDLLIKILKDNNLLSYSTIQSFDKRVLEYINIHYPDEVRLSFLIEGQIDYKKEIQHIGFVPEILSPEWDLVNNEMIQFARDSNTLVIPWTVNDLSQMRQLIDMGVSGIISDFPDLYKHL